MRHARPIFESSNRELYDLFQFSPAVRSGPFIFISGVVGVDEQHCAFSAAKDEYHTIFVAIGKLLAVEGATMADIVALDSFHVSDDLIADLREFNEVCAQYMSAPHPAWTAIGVAGLAVPGARAEVRVTAYLGEGGGAR